MPSFLNKFFPSVLRKEAGSTPKNIYCVYDSQVLTSFTSSLYIAGLAASLVASRLARIVGRRNVMVLGGCTFFAGSAINGGAVNVAMLILGRILLGFGVGFTNQVSLPISNPMFGFAKNIAHQNGRFYYIPKNGILDPIISSKF